jgi:tetratricopeptide (TPR) repeat protein
VALQYRAFLSYSHAADDRLGAILQSSLHRFAKPWYRMRAINVFRDKTGLAVSPALWPSIERALQASEFFILMAAPEAAASQWVNREVEWWRANRSVETLLIVLTGGELAWSGADFDWQRTTALPPGLEGAFRNEPLHLDLRWARSKDDLSLRNPQFREAVAELTAPLRGQTKESLIGEDLRQHRRTRRLAWAAGVLLLLLTIASLTAGWLARQQRNRAVHARSEAERLIEFMLFDLRDRLEPIGRLDLLEGVNRRTRGFYEAFPAAQDDPLMRYQRAVSLSYAADYHRRRGDPAQALRAATESWQLLKQTADRDPRDVEAQRHLAVGTIELARVHQDLGDLAQTEQLMRAAVSALGPLESGADDRLKGDLAYCERALGGVLHERRKYEGFQNFERSLRLYRDLASRNPSVLQWRQGVADTLDARGAMLKDFDRLPDALQSYDESLEIAKQLADEDQTDAQRQYDLAAAHGAMATVLAEQGHWGRAQEELSIKRRIVQRLVDLDPPNMVWQQDLADTDGQIGSVLARTGRLDEAVQAHDAATSRLERLVALNARNPMWSQALASAHHALGDTQFTAGRYEASIRAYLASLKIMMNLGKAYPDHPGVQRAKAISYSKAAQIYADGVQDRSAALALLQDVVATFERMTKAYPRNVVAQNDLAVAQEQIAKISADGGRLGEAVAAYRSALTIRTQLAANDPSNLPWQGALITLQHSAGTVLLKHGDVDAARDLFSQALSHSQQLSRDQPNEVSWHSLTAVSYERLGAVHRLRKDPAGAATAYRSALASLREVVRLAPSSADAQGNLAIVQQLITQAEAEARRDR